MSDTIQPIVFVITGDSGASRSAFCERLMLDAREAGWKVAGVLFHPVYENNHRVAVDGEDLANNITRRFAERGDSAAVMPPWTLNSAALKWGNEVFSTCLPCDLLIADELDLLDMDQNQGRETVQTALRTRQCAIALLTVRPEALGQALMDLAEANLIEIETPEDGAEKARRLSEQLF